MVDQPSPYDGHRLETPMRMLRKTRYDTTVVHVPAILTAEVAADSTFRQRHSRPQGVIAPWERVVVVHAEKKGISRVPHELERCCRKDGF
jgi:hypothetical protein